MKILHISAFYSNTRNFGASTRFKNLINTISNDSKNEHTIIAPNFTDDRFKVLKLKNKSRILKIIYIWIQVIVYKPDIIVSDFLPTPMIGKMKLIYIVHDVRLKSNFKKSGIKSSKWVYKLLLNKASKIITVSQFTKSQLSEFYNGPISVVPNGVSENFYFDPTIKKQGLLYVAKHEERKNIQKYLEICNKYYKVTGEESYLVSDYTGWLPEGCNLVNQLSETQLTDLYRSAKIYISTSNFEGFGMPLIEAYVSGCQLMVSDIAAHQEVLRYMDLDYDCIFSCSEKPEKIVEKIISQKFIAPDLGNFDLSWDKVGDKFLFEITGIQ